MTMELESRIQKDARAWAEAKKKDIAELAGKEAMADYRAIAYAHVASELMAEMYFDIKRDFNEPTAQATIKEAFAIVGVLLRVKGAPFRVSTNAEFHPLEVPKRDETLPAPSKCECSLDQDDRCETCLGVLNRFWGAAGESVRIMNAASLAGKDVCKPCMRRHLDASLANFVRTELSKFNPETAEAALGTMFAVSQGIQAMPMPLTMKAWNDIMESHQ